EDARALDEPLIGGAGLAETGVIVKRPDLRQAAARGLRLKALETGSRPLAPEAQFVFREAMRADGWGKAGIDRVSDGHDEILVLDPNGGVSRSLEKSMPNKELVHRRVNDVNASVHEPAKACARSEEWPPARAQHSCSGCGKNGSENQ